MMIKVFAGSNLARGMNVYPSFSVVMPSKVKLHGDPIHRQTPTKCDKDSFTV